MSDLPDYHFRIRENGAAVFRIDTANRQRRIEMEQIATVHLGKGEIRPQGARALTEEDLAEITRWIEARRALLARREMDEMHRTVEQLNLTAHWAQTRATPEQLDAVTDALLLAMHDLRSVLVRKKADRTGPPET